MRPIEEAPVKPDEEHPGRFLLWDARHPRGIIGRWNGVGWFDLDGEPLAPRYWHLIPELADLQV